ncbi:MAG TPA: RNA polymerase sigma factor [Solirubrobacterales bacterium]|nr:RNA polymerase sigma factor [Solirubrobacterales bacterium]
MEASTLTHAQRRGLFARRSPLLRFQDDEKLVALTRRGHQHAFDSLVERYQSRLLGFCRQMLGSTEDAEDVLQEVFVAAYNAMVADQRPIAVRPWLYRIARNRCLNHLRKPTADGQDTMDTHPHMNGVTTHERVQNREEFRSLLSDVGQLPETQRSALLLREIDAMSYEEIAKAMDTTVPGVKSLLVRARIALAESSQSRQLTCDEVRIELAEAAEGLAKVGGPARRHIKGCDACRAFRTQLRSDTKALAAIFPAAPLLILKGTLLAKLSGLFGGGGGGAAAGAGGGGAAGAGAAGAGAGAAGAGAAGAGAGAAGAAGAGAAAAGGSAVATSAAVGGAAAAGGAAAGGAGAAAATGAAAAIGTKAAAGIATAAILAGGAAEIQHVTSAPSPRPEPKVKQHVNAGRTPAAPVPVQPAAPSTPPVETPAATPPATATPPAPSETVTVPPQTAQPGTTGGVASTAPLGKRKRHKGNSVANTDSKGTTTVPQTGPVTTGVEPSATCDADGDGVIDPGAPTTCSPGTTGTTGVQGTTTTAPAPATSQPTSKSKRHAKSHGKSKSTSKSKSTKSKSTSKSKSSSKSKPTPKKRPKQPRASA